MEYLLSDYDGDPSEHIAIIGMTGRFPGARDIHAFWQNLRDGVESITFFTAEDLAHANIEQSLLENPRYVGADGVIEDMDLFDAEFFNIPPSVAEIMDPQHRLFLECAWEVMEQAGYDSESYQGRVAVYGSANLSTYLVRNIMSHPDLRQTATSFQTLITNDKDFIATRVSYKMNLTGPSMSVATLCSSSSVAIHLGCQTLLNYQCDLALAGAISLQASRNEAFFYQEGGIGDPDGHCRAFDAQASGTVSGSGIGLVALKRLEDALEDGDTIHAVIRGTAVNNDGAIKYSYTAPSVEGQADVIAEAVSLAEVHPETITYVETHGTGTRLGDPIEVTALTKAFRGNGAQEKQYCAIGSVKTNIGHLVNAGGVASLIKTVLAMQHGQIPASLNYERPNPEIDFENSPFFVNAALREWRTNGFPRRAGVSSFGIGGTNVHIVVEEAPQVQPSGESRPWQLLIQSAQTDAALEQQTANLVAYLRDHPDANPSGRADSTELVAGSGRSLADVAFTLQVGRKGFGYRRVLLCRDVPDAVEALAGQDTERVLTQFQETQKRPVAFLFPGLDEPTLASSVEPCVNVGRELYQSEPTFREQIDACAEILAPRLGLDLRQALYPAEGKEEQAQQHWARPKVARAALFALEYALAKLWQEWGVEPQAMLGQGVGECVAACLSGVFVLQDALALVTGAGPVAPDGLNAPQIPFLSGASGTWITEAEATDPAHWARALDQTRPFAEQVRPLLKESQQALLEVGPGKTLGALVMAHPDKADQQVVLSSLGQGRDTPSEIADLLAALGRLWLAGVRVDWYGFHAHEYRHRLPLPTYPFQRQRYWIEPHKQADQPVLPDATQPRTFVSTLGLSSDRRLRRTTVTKKLDLADWFYVPVWKTAPSPKTRDFSEDEGAWLLFVDEGGVGAAMAEQLRQAGQTVVTVEVGEFFNRIEDDVYALDPRRRVHYAALFRDLQAADSLPKRVVHLWSVTPDQSTAPNEEIFRQAQDNGFYSLLFLAQVLGEQTLTEAVQLWVVSNQAQKVESVDVPRPEKATILGLCKVIPQENPYLVCHHVDVALPQVDMPSQDDLSRQLLAEIGSQSPDTVVAYRHHQRWLQTFEPLRLSDEAAPVRPLRENGVYLITSGLADISWALADYLARAVQARLVLVEDAAFPRREQWPQWLAKDDPDDGVGRKIQNIRDLEATGAEVLVVHANLTDEAQVQDALAQARARFGHLHGLIHAVGDMGDDTFKTILDTDHDTGVWSFENRMRGLLVLEKALAGHELDFCLLVSSLSSVLGGVGQAAYAAANLFMDAFAARHRGPWLSVNWDAWQFEAERGRIGALTPRLAQFAISAAEGAEVFQRILASHTGHQIVVSTGDLGARMAQWLGTETLQVQERPQAKRHARPHLPNPYVAPTTEVEQILVEAWQEALGIEQIGIDDNFFDLGGDSLIAVRTITLLEKKLQTKIPTANLYQTPSVRALAELLSQDEEQATQERATKLEKRKEELSRRNLLLQQRRKR